MHRHPHAQLIAVKRWADLGLYEAVSRGFEALAAEDQFAMLRVLDHIHTVDRIFQAHLRGVPHGFSAARSEVMPSLRALSEGTWAVDDWYVDYVDGLDADALEQPVDFVFTSGKPARMTRGEMLLHVCLHGAYHRGNAGAVLQLRGLTPGRDSITDYLEDAA